MGNKDIASVSESYSIVIDDVAKFRYELVKMIEKAMIQCSPYDKMTSSQIAEEFEKTVNSR